jgi:hypothetical protein
MMDFPSEDKTAAIFLSCRYGESERHSRDLDAIY